MQRSVMMKHIFISCSASAPQSEPTLPLRTRRDTPPFRGKAYEPTTASPAVRNSTFLNAGLVSTAPGPPFPTKQLCTLPPLFPACPIRQWREGTYALSSAAGSVASNVPPKRGMSPKPQERCRELPSSFLAVATTSTTAVMPGWCKEVWK